MKTISFSAVEVLPSLLDKSKTQTIRPAWKYIENKSPSEFDPPTSRCNKGIFENLIEKEPRFKVGELVRLYWKQRSKYKVFNRKTGEPIKNLKEMENVRSAINIWSSPFEKPASDKRMNIFHKILGEAEITEVFEIELSIYSVKRIDKALYSVGELAKRDGFKDYYSLKQYFNKNYDISKPKRFYVYRFKYIS